jgi:hypothetical protein
MFLYLLRPAAGWKGFGSLSITVIPNKSRPYIIDSSLMLTRNSWTGIYTGIFDTLPDKDFYFTLYSKDKMDGPRTNRGMIKTAAVFLMPLIIIFLLAAVGLIVWLILRNRKKVE